LGKSGLMPNKKDGTITDDLAGLIKTLKSGTKVLFRNDKAGHIRLRIGKKDFNNNLLKENIETVMHQIITMKPAKVKMTNFIKKLYISGTQSIGLELPKKFVNVK